MAAARPILDALPARERAVIELCVGAGLTGNQAAAALGIPAGTATLPLARHAAALKARIAPIARAAAKIANTSAKSIELQALIALELLVPAPPGVPRGTETADRPAARTSRRDASGAGRWLYHWPFG